MKHVLLLSLVFLLVMSLVSAEYLHAGDNGYNGGEGIFREGTNVQTIARSMSDPKFTPLVADFNANGSNEILMHDGSTLKLYTPNLVPIDEVSLGFAADSFTISPAIAHNVDGDSDIEIIIGSVRDKTIQMFEFNGSDLVKFREHNLTSAWENPTTNLVLDNADMVLACDDIPNCFAAVTNHTTTSNENTALFFLQFDNDSISSTPNFIDVEDTLGSEIGNICFPSNKGMSAGQADSDSDREYVVSYIQDRDSSGSQEYVHAHIETNFDTVTNIVLTDVDSDADRCGGASCDLNNCLTDISPVTQVDTTGGGNLESAWVRYISASSQIYVVELFDSDGNQVDSFPDANRDSMTVAGNVVSGKFYPDSAGNDLCGVAFDTSISEVSMTCYSSNTAENPSSIFREFFSYKTNISSQNISTSNFVPALSFAADHSDYLVDGCDSGTNNIDLDDIVTPYGVYSLDMQCDDFISLPTGPCESFGLCDLREEWSNPFTAGTFISDDINDAGQDNVLTVNSNRFILFDTLSADAPATIDNDSILLNPCRDSPWKQNTTVFVSYIVNDGDQTNPDDVKARAVLYADTSNEQEVVPDTNIFQNSGYTFDFTFEQGANKTTNTGVLRLFANDTGTGDEQSLDIAFSVASSGLEFGDCSEVGIAAEDQTNIGDTIQNAQNNLIQGDDNALVNITNELVDTSKLPPLILWLILFLVTIYGTFKAPVLFGKKTSDVPMLLMFVLALETIVFITIGVLMGIIPVTIILLLLLIGGAIFGLYIRNLLQGRNANS